MYLFLVVVASNRSMSSWLAGAWLRAHEVIRSLHWQPWSLS